VRLNRDSSATGTEDPAMFMPIEIQPHALVQLTFSLLYNYHKPAYYTVEEQD